MVEPDQAAARVKLGPQPHRQPLAMGRAVGLALFSLIWTFGVALWGFLTDETITPLVTAPPLLCLGALGFLEWRRASSSAPLRRQLDRLLEHQRARHPVGRRG
jgi:hypothetical protein